MKIENIFIFYTSNRTLYSWYDMNYCINNKINIIKYNLFFINNSYFLLNLNFLQMF